MSAVSDMCVSGNRIYIAQIRVCHSCRCSL